MNDAAFRQLITAELDSVYRLGCHLTQSRQTAEDYVQETYLRALRSASTFKLTEHGARPWLFKILHNVICSGGSKLKRERSVIDEFRHLTPDPATSLGSVDETNSIDWEDVDGRLKAAVAELPLAHRETFILSAVEGLRYREIAEVTAVPIGTVMSRLSRARRILALRLVDLARETRVRNGSRTPEASPPT